MNHSLQFFFYMHTRCASFSCWSSGQLAHTPDLHFAEQSVNTAAPKIREVPAGGISVLTQCICRHELGVAGQSSILCESLVCKILKHSVKNNCTGKGLKARPAIHSTHKSTKAQNTQLIPRATRAGKKDKSKQALVGHCGCFAQGFYIPLFTRDLPPLAAAKALGGCPPAGSHGLV